MTIDKWTAVIMHLFVLCGVRKMDEQQHAYYIAAMFAELKDKFTDEEIGIAARQIAETETLYGAYPSLAVWLKYSPAQRIQAHIENSKLADIREFLCDIAETDPMVFDAASMAQDFVNTYGEQGQFVLEEFGGIRGLRGALYKASQFNRESITNDFLKSWQRASTDVRMNIPQLAENQTLQITKGGNNE